MLLGHRRCFLNAGAKEKLIIARTEHRSDSLFKYEKAGDEKIREVSTVLGLRTSTSTYEVAITKQKEESSCLESSDFHENVTASSRNSCFLSNCSVKIRVNYIK